MKVLFILKTGATIEWPVPDDLQAGFNFVGMARSVRCDGFFQSPNMHIKYADMQGMLFTSEAVPAPELKGTLQ